MKTFLVDRTIVMYLCICGLFPTFSAVCVTFLTICMVNCNDKYSLYLQRGSNTVIDFFWTTNPSISIIRSVLWTKP
jgi:hypothetical protein